MTLLAVSELITNAVNAMLLTGSSERIELSLRLFSDFLLVEVADSSPYHPVPRLAANSLAESGRGLAVVEDLSEDWGYFMRMGRKVVFCKMPVIPHKDN